MKKTAKLFLRKSLVLLAGLWVGAAALPAADIPPVHFALPSPVLVNQSTYYWNVTPVDNTAELLTLFCRSCKDQLLDDSSSRANDTLHAGADIPLVSVLRDTLGDQNPENDRLLYVWLLSYVRPNLGQRILSAVPFFYWHVGAGDIHSNNAAPLLDLTTPEHTLISGVGHQILQSSLLDPTATPIRATSRAYHNNETAYQRLHLEEAASYLREAPISTGNETSLTRPELDTLLARLELRKSLFGGLVRAKHMAHIGEEAGYEQERVRSRNWEVLRQCAERTGLIFEPLNLAGNSNSYAVLWFPLHTTPPATGSSRKPIWKVLNIHNPWSDHHLAHWRGPVYNRSLDENGSLLPEGVDGVTPVQLVPLGVYSLEYPKTPLLLVDLRGSMHLRRDEMMQRAVNDVTAGVIGLSHFSNWYYYAGADLYDFIVSRHGAAMNQAERLDCYAQFRVALALDRQLDPRLRSQIEKQVHTLNLNPLEAGAARELDVAQAQYGFLLQQVQDGRLAARINRDRRAELAQFGEPAHARIARIILHDATFGAYTHRAKQDSENLALLDRERRILYRLNFLDSLAGAGTPPEVAYNPSRIRDSIADLQHLMNGVRSPLIRTHVAHTLQQLKSISQDPNLQADCANTLALLEEPTLLPKQSVRRQHGQLSGVAAFLSSAQPESTH